MIYHTHTHVHLLIYSARGPPGLQLALAVQVDGQHDLGISRADPEGSGSELPGVACTISPKLAENEDACK